MSYTKLQAAMAAQDNAYDDGWSDGAEWAFEWALTNLASYRGVGVEWDRYASEFIHRLKADWKAAGENDDIGTRDDEEVADDGAKQARIVKADHAKQMAAKILQGGGA